MTKPRPLFALSLLLVAVPVLAAPPAQIRAEVQGELIEAKGTSAKAEIVSFGGELVPGLLKAAEKTTVRVADWPVGPDERADVLLTRFDVYAPGAKVFVVEARGERQIMREIPRSRLAFFSGTAADDPRMTVFAAVDPDSGDVNGFTQTRDAFHEIHPLSHVPSLAVAKGSRRHLVAPAEVFLKERGEQSSWACGQSGAPLDFMQEMQEMSERMVAETAPLGSVTSEAITSLHTATIAVDTDNELLQIKFANNTTTATNYIASLIASMTVIYERDALVRLLQGTTILRPSTTADPYTQATSGNASSAKLQEFSNVWNTTYSGVTRALAMMLSGKQPSGGASGIAWLTSLCNKYYGTSFSQVYTTGTTPSSGDILVVAHEIGHNFGSPHTHCYSTPIDNCYNAEAGCFSGTKSCPAAQTINGVTSVTGTLMSYCHLSGLSGCTSKTVFHPRTISEKLAPAIQNAVGSCIFPAAPQNPPVVAALFPKSGTTAGGTPVTIAGSGFQAGASVTFGGTPASSVVVVNATTITAVTPARPTGTVAVAVTNPDAQSSSLANGFFYVPPTSLSDFYTVSPCRVIDTRNANGPLGGPVLSPLQIRNFTIAGNCGVPASAKAVVVNVTSVDPVVAGSFQAFPGNAFPMGTSLVSFGAGQIRASGAMLMLSTDGAGTLGVQNGSAGNTHFVLDVTGYYL